ncbi:MAG: beta-ketoacyl synthase N-terminal-like domain-containing protein [Oligoflexales bacterium]
MQTSILGIGCISPSGTSVESICDALVEGRRPVVSFESILYRHKTYQVPNLQCVPFDLEGPASAHRRASLLAKMSVFATTSALSDANLRPGQDRRWGVIVASGYGPESCSSKNFMRIYATSDGASPTLFTNSVHNSVASTLLRNLAFTGPAVSIADHGNLVDGGLTLAHLWLAQELVEYVILVFGEENCPFRNYFELSRWEKLGRSIPQQDETRRIPSEGCVCLILGPERLSSRYPKLRFAMSETSGANIDARIFLDGRPLSEKLSLQLQRRQARVSVADVLGSTPIASVFDLAIACQLE